MRSWMPKNSPIMLPNTTTATAPSSPKASMCCPRGSRPAIIGARKIPAARKEVAVQKIASCTCQVLTRLYGRTRARSIPKKLARSAR
jgi:hypothetical protein